MSSHTYRGVQHDTAPIIGLGRPVRTLAAVPSPHSVPNDESSRSARRAPVSSDTPRSVVTTALYAIAAAGFGLALAAAVTLIIAFDDMPEQLRIAGWTAVICLFLAALAGIMTVMVIHALRGVHERHAQDIYDFVDRASQAASERYQRILDGQDEIRSQLRELAQLVADQSGAPPDAEEVARLRAYAAGLAGRPLAEAPNVLPMPRHHGA